MTADKEKLLPCLFCGGGNVLISHPHIPPPDHYVAICTPDTDSPGCGASGTWKDSEQEAIESWNQRAKSPDTIPVPRELLEACLEWMEKLLEEMPDSDFGQRNLFKTIKTVKELLG